MFEVLGKVLIRLIAKVFQINLLRYAYSLQGIGVPNDMMTNGEYFFLKKLRKVVEKKKPVIFDVGANKGEYIKLVKKVFPEAIIHAFEPNPQTFKELKLVGKSFSNTYLNNFALGQDQTKVSLYTYENDQTSGHSSLHSDLHNFTSKSLIHFTVDSFSMREYCVENAINEIDFLKLDVEGSELNVLKGASELISSGKISCIQFEFNEMNIASRTFLKDFYHLLEDKYFLFRLKEGLLAPLGEYAPKYEIFIIQNLLAINKEKLPFFTNKGII